MSDTLTTDTLESRIIATAQKESAEAVSVLFKTVADAVSDFLGVPRARRSVRPPHSTYFHDEQLYDSRDIIHANLDALLPVLRSNVDDKAVPQRAIDARAATMRNRIFAAVGQIAELAQRFGASPEPE